MPKKAFSSFYRKSVRSEVAPESNKMVIGDSCLEEVTYQDLSAFPDQIVTEVTFRLNILRFLRRKCEKIGIKSIEPHRVELQRSHDRKVPSAITIYRWWLAFRDSDYNPTSLAPNFQGRGNSRAGAYFAQFITQRRPVLGNHHTNPLF